MKKSFNEFWKKALEAISRPEMRILPGQLAFFLVLSIIPLIALLGSLATAFSISLDAIVEAINTAVPKEAVDLLLPIISGQGVSINIIIFYGSAFLLASNGPHSMIISSNLLYKVKNKDYLSRRIKALIMTIILVLLILFVLIVPAFGDTIVSFIAKFINSDSLRNTIQITYNILKYPLSILLIFFNIKLLYTIAPDKKVKSKDTTYGAFFTTIGWILSTEVYSFYVETFSKYNLFYGSISNILILLLWVYILAYIFVFGMALNCSSEKEE